MSSGLLLLWLVASLSSLLLSTGGTGIWWIRLPPAGLIALVPFLCFMAPACVIATCWCSRLMLVMCRVSVLLTCTFAQVSRRTLTLRMLVVLVSCFIRVIARQICPDRFPWGYPIVPSGLDRS